MAEEAKRKYGAPQLTIHRADLLDALRRQLPQAAILLGHRVEARSAPGRGSCFTVVAGRPFFDDAPRKTSSLAAMFSAEPTLQPAI